jgi:hypothetical protein
MSTNKSFEKALTGVRNLYMYTYICIYLYTLALKYTHVLTCIYYTHTGYDEHK